MKKDNEESINLKDAKMEDFTPNKKRQKLKAILTVILSLIITGLVILYFYKPKEEIKEKKEEKETYSALNISKLAKLIATNEEYTIKLKVTDLKIDQSKIKWTSSDEKIVTLTKCNKNECVIKGKSLGEATIKATYDKQNYDSIIIKVIDSKKVYVYQNKSSLELPTERFLFASFNYDKETLKTSKLVYEYTCSSLDCTYLNTSSNNLLIKENEKYYIIDIPNDQKNNIDFNFKDYQSYKLVEYNKKVIGLILNDQKYYSLTKDVITISTNSKEEYFIYNQGLLKNNQIIISNYKDDRAVLYDINTGTKIKKFDTSLADFEIINIGSKTYYLLNKGYVDSLYQLYDINYNLKLNNIAYYTLANNSLYVIEEGNTKVFKKYDESLNLVSTSMEYQKVYSFAKEYVLATDISNNLLLVDLDEKPVHTYLTLNNDLYFHSALSGFYETQGKSGIYVVIEDSTLGENDEGMVQGYEYYYNPSTKESGKFKTEIGGYAKPILYLYPLKDNTRVRITFNHPEYLTTTYPKYLNNWTVKANKDGTLIDENKKEYYALYWEEIKYRKVSFDEGFYVTKDDAIAFLEEKLTTIGLNNREKNEFIMYWLPVLEKNKQSLVYFELTSSREEFNKINIDPIPNSLLRVAIHIKKVNKKTKITKEDLPTFKRTGFTAVEWGGVNY